MKIIKRASTTVSRKKARSNKELIPSGRKPSAFTSGDIDRYNSALAVLFRRDIEETNAAVAILANIDIASLKAKYKRFEKKT